MGIGHLRMLPGMVDNAYAGFSNNDRQHCRSVAQTTAFLHGNEWTSLRTFVVTFQLELI